MNWVTRVIYFYIFFLYFLYTNLYIYFISNSSKLIYFDCWILNFQNDEIVKHVVYRKKMSLTLLAKNISQFWVFFFDSNVSKCLGISCEIYALKAIVRHTSGSWALRTNKTVSLAWVFSITWDKNI